MKLDPTKRDTCGDMKGWNAHNRAGERQCMPCKVAHAEYQNAWRHRTGRSHSRLYTNAEIDDIRGVNPARIRAAIRMLYPDDMTPTAKRVLERILDEHDKPDPT